MLFRSLDIELPSSDPYAMNEKREILKGCVPNVCSTYLDMPFRSTSCGPFLQTRLAHHTHSLLVDCVWATTTACAEAGCRNRMFSSRVVRSRRARSDGENRKPVRQLPAVALQRIFRLTVRAWLQERGIQNIAYYNETSVRSSARGHARRNPKD